MSTTVGVLPPDFRFPPATQHTGRFGAVAACSTPLPVPQPQDFRYIGWVWRQRSDIPALTDFKYAFVRDHTRWRS